MGVMPVVVGAIQVIGSTVAMHGQPDTKPLNLLGYALLVVGAAALVARRRWPLPTLVVTLATTVSYLVLDYPRGPFFLAAVVAVFGAVRRANRLLTWALCAIAYLAYVVAAHASLGQYLVVGAWTAVTVVLAEAARVRGEHFTEIGLARAAAARARQEQSRRQASDERLRIARELHDVLGHHLSLINVRAGVGLHLLDTDPEQAREALGAIKVASAEALREVRGVLSALNPQSQSAPRSPAPGLADLDALADDTRAAGLAVTVRRSTDDTVAIPGEVERAAYRIVQEALTNVRRHAGAAATVTVTIGYGPDELTVQVDDTGPGPAPSTSDGNGIPGMRERAAALGGTLHAGRGPDGGFRVDARLPLNEATARSSQESSTRDGYPPQENS
jgi:signal transduction histidine kinase